MQRILETEWLDLLPADDRQAIGSRRDVARINGLMGHPALLDRQLTQARQTAPLGNLADLGAGNGLLMLRVAKRLARRGIRSKVRLVDQKPSVTQETADRFSALGWEGEVVTADAFAWLRGAPPIDAVVATLFLHHFNALQLAALFGLLIERSRLVVACEPRRSSLALVAARCLGFIGCNATTRHDAPASVRAGFDGRELSDLWPEEHGWRLEERPAGLFTHLFVARRVG